MVSSANVARRLRWRVNSPFPHSPFLDQLRPSAGWKTDAAVVSAYSAQMPVIAAVLLALAGEVDEAGSGSRVGLVRALTGLRGKVHVVLQSGRLVSGRHDTAITGLFDQFLLQVPWDETAGATGKSWHAKFVLVRQSPTEPGLVGERWIFVLGSRNLTLDTSWDIGISLEGGDGFEARRGCSVQRIDGVSNVATELTKLFPALQRWSSFVARLRNVNWWVPDGLRVAEVRLMLPDDVGRALPLPPSGLRRLVAVAPFLDEGAVQELLGWPIEGAASCRQLLSTRNELTRALGGVRLLGDPELLALAEPSFDAAIPTESADDELAPERIGLHAKMIHAEHASGGSLWLGSPNLTRRAWTRNAEAVVRVDSTDVNGIEILASGLAALLEKANLVRPDELQAISKPLTITDCLSAARNQVAAQLAVARQRRCPSGLVMVECDEPPLPNDAEITLQCGQIKGALTAWPSGVRSLKFPSVSGAVESECIHCRLELQRAELSWVQLIRFEPHLDLEDRDAQVLSEYLGSRQMLTWIHAVLSDCSDGDEGGTWDSFGEPKRPKGSAPDDFEFPTLEQALRMWLRDRTRLDEVDRILKLRHHNAAHADQSGRQELDRFASNWETIRIGLRGAGK
jgi:hypothetical protein